MHSEHSQKQSRPLLGHPIINTLFDLSCAKAAESSSEWEEDSIPGPKARA